MPHALLSHHDGVWGARGRSLNKKNSNFLAGQQDSPVKGRRVGAGGPGEGDVGDVEEAGDEHVADAGEDDDSHMLKWSLSALVRHLQAAGVDTDGVFAKVEDLVIRTLLTVESQVVSRGRPRGGDTRVRVRERVSGCVGMCACCAEVEHICTCADQCEFAAVRAASPQLLRAFWLRCNAGFPAEPLADRSQQLAIAGNRRATGQEDQIRHGD